MVPPSYSADKAARRSIFADPIFLAALVALALVSFMLGAAHSWHREWTAAKTQPQLPVPFYLHQSVSDLPSTNGTQISTQKKKDAPKVKLFVGIFTAPSEEGDKYGLRRKAIRETFLPDLDSLPDVKWQFVVGRSPESHLNKQMEAEAKKFPGTFMHLDMDECYRCLPEKTLAFVLYVHQNYDADWVLKMDDDLYLAPTRLPLAIEQWHKMGAQYIGCMKHGDLRLDVNDKWYEPAWRLIGTRYHMHAYGSIYALSSKVVGDVLAPNGNLLRKIANEDTNMGLWMISFNVTYFEDMRLCTPRCHPHGVGFLDNMCSGLCKPLKHMYDFHRSYMCRRQIPKKSSLKYLPSWPGHNFDDMKVY